MSVKDQISEQLITTNKHTMYNGWSNQRSQQLFGYHSFDLPGVRIRGQRTPYKRIEKFRKHFNFNNKILVDVGCNVGGMLFHIPNLKKGYGFDFDDKCIVAANNIAKILNRTDLLFFTIDFDKESHDILNVYVQDNIDVVFLLSLGNWISTHKELYKFFINKGADIFLELNWAFFDEDQLDVFREFGLEPELIIEGSPDDNTNSNKIYRSTYFIKNTYLKDKN